VQALLAQVEAHVDRELAALAAETGSAGGSWPQIDYADIANERVTAQQIDHIHRRGCLVIRNHFPARQARAWDADLEHYLDSNDFDRVYQGMGDDFFGTLAASRPPILPIYWSPAQMQARQHQRMARAQTFLNRLWRFQSQGQGWFDPGRNLLYPDR